jgi:hypothetical protein
LKRRWGIAWRGCGIRGPGPGRSPIAFTHSRAGAIVEVTARKAAEARTFEQAKPEILAALQVIKARQATLDIKNSLRQSSASRIKLFE